MQLTFILCFITLTALPFSYTERDMKFREEVLAKLSAKKPNVTSVCEVSINPASLGHFYFEHLFLTGISKDGFEFVGEA